MTNKGSDRAAAMKAAVLLEEARNRLAAGDAGAARAVAEHALNLCPEHVAVRDFLHGLAAMPRPALSVIVPTCDRVDILRLCLAHLEAQTLPASDFEVIVVDDASTDATPGFLATYRAPFPFRHLRQEQRGGPARARNKGIIAARGDVVVFLNDDALLCPRGLEIHHETHKAVPDASFSVLGRFEPPAAFGYSPWGHVISHSDLIFDYAGMRHGGVYDFLHYYTCNVSTPRAGLIAAGMFDASFTGPLWGAEDIELGYRLQRAGLPVVYREDCHAIHQHDLSLDDMARMFRVRGGGAVRIFARYHELPCHYREIAAQDVAYWRNLPRRVTERVDALCDRLRAIDAFRLPPGEGVPHRFTGEQFPALTELYYGLWRKRSNELLNVVDPLCQGLDHILDKCREGGQTLQSVARPLYFAGLFLRWFYDTVGICASEHVHRVPLDDRCAAAAPPPLAPDDAPLAKAEGTGVGVRAYTADSGGAPVADAVSDAPAGTGTGAGAKGRILLACDFFWPSVGGTELFVEDLGRRLMEQGYTVEVACRDLPERMALQHEGMRIHGFACRDRFHDGDMGPGIDAYRAHVLRGGYRAVLCLAHPDTWVCHALHTLPAERRPRLIMMPRINAANLALWKERSVMDEVLEVLRRSDLHITVSEHGCDAATLHGLGVPRMFIPHAVDPVATPGDSRNRYGLALDTPLFVCVGNFWPVKNQSAFLRAMTRLEGTWQCVLAGAALPWEGERAFFMECWRIAARDPRLRILGPLPPAEASALIRDADALLVPSQGESAGPLVVLQAMAHGVPWVATPGCNAVHDEAGGVIVPVEHFPDAVRGLITAPETARELAADGHEHWRTCFTWEKTLPLFMDAIEGRASASTLHMPAWLRTRRDALARTICAAHAAGGMVDDATPTAPATRPAEADAADPVGARPTTSPDNTTEPTRPANDVTIPRLTPSGTRQQASAPRAVPSEATSSGATSSGTASSGVPPRVSAIVSLYNAERFVRGCLDDLLTQTLGPALEIIVIDACSPQDERAIVHEYMQRHRNIRYVRTEEREGVYASWNRGVRMARGTYVTNANADDRHRPDALERMADALDNAPDAGFAYGDCKVGHAENERYDENAGLRVMRFPHFFAPATLLYCQLGPQPLWRRTVHDTVGFFDEGYRACADWDFDIRLAAAFRGVHVPETLGLYLEHEAAITFRDDTMTRENDRVQRRWQNPDAVEERYRAAGVPCATPTERALVHLDMGLRALRFYPPWTYGAPASNVGFARRCLRHALRLEPGLSTATELLALPDGVLTVLDDLPSPLGLPSQAELAGLAG